MSVFCEDSFYQHEPFPPTADAHLPPYRITLGFLKQVKI